MQIYTESETRKALPFDQLIEAIREIFKSKAEAPLRHHHSIPLEEQPVATLLLMPAWRESALGGIKIVNVNPGNSALGIPALSSTYLLFDAQTGRHLALLDGGEITNRRTAAASALAASYLAAENAQTLLIIGAGRVASNMAYAFRIVRPIKEVLVWDINKEMAANLVVKLRGDGIVANEVKDLENEFAKADIISCATLATEPIVMGEWLRPGQHLDLIGSFTPHMRETDDMAMTRARVYIDTQGALEESGDLIGPLKSGALSKDRIAGDLFGLCRGEVQGRCTLDEVTLFKGVGSAIEDLAAAMLVYACFGHKTSD